MPSNEGNDNVALEVDDSFQQNDNKNIHNDDSNSSLDLKDLRDNNINLKDLPLNDDSYLNSAIGKDEVFDDISLKNNKLKYTNNGDKKSRLDTIKTNININNEKFKSLANFNPNNIMNNSTNLSSYVDDNSLFDLKASQQLSVVNSNTSVPLSEEETNLINIENEPRYEFTENSEFTDIDLEDQDQVENIVNKFVNSPEFNESELNSQYQEYDDDEYALLVDDEAILKSLYNIDNGMAILLNRVKQNCNSCKVIILNIKFFQLIYIFSLYIYIYLIF